MQFFTVGGVNRYSSLSGVFMKNVLFVWIIALFLISCGEVEGDLKDSFYGTWSLPEYTVTYSIFIQSDHIQTSASNSASTSNYYIEDWIEITNTNSDTKQDFPHGYKLRTTKVPEGSTEDFILYMKKDLETIGRAFVENPAAGDIQFYAKQ